jgi:hypothetical protein
LNISIQSKDASFAPQEQHYLNYRQVSFTDQTQKIIFLGQFWLAIAQPDHNIRP